MGASAIICTGAVLDELPERSAHLIVLASLLGVGLVAGITIRIRKSIKTQGKYKWQ